ncbi:hypothetical protein UY3_01644 [Chelonia mydas]|uniref:Uncharacterized protein n=1 Tax=Chelonia mydas TaxID=8469 RepID=M7BVB0_CHEMY|nr:hypothetical protein UY3_01644 [Chelonia mydas]
MAMLSDTNWLMPASDEPEVEPEMLNALSLSTGCCGSGGPHATQQKLSASQDWPHTQYDLQQQKSWKCANVVGKNQVLKVDLDLR